MLFVGVGSSFGVFRIDVLVVFGRWQQGDSTLKCARMLLLQMATGTRMMLRHMLLLLICLMFGAGMVKNCPLTSQLWINPYPLKSSWKFVTGKETQYKKYEFLLVVDFQFLLRSSLMLLILLLLSASLYVSKRGAYWDRLCRDVVGWLVVTRVHCGQTVRPRPIVTMEH